MISRKTKQKEIIAKEVDKTSKFFTAEDLSKKLKNIGIATIYRFLKEARKKNEVYAYSCEGKTIYSKKKVSHCHFVCEETGKTIHFDVDSIDFLKKKIPGDITSFQIEVRGICKNHK